MISKSILPPYTILISHAGFDVGNVKFDHPPSVRNEDGVGGRIPLLIMHA